MPRFEDSAVSNAQVEEVWKLLYDPARFPEWWAGIETVEPEPGDEGHAARFTYYPSGYPDYPMPQLLETSRDNRRVVVSCLVSDLHFRWLLEPLASGDTRIRVEVDIPPEEAHRLATQKTVIRQSLAQLAALAAEAASDSGA
ncbi:MULTISPECIES: SRPBCC family protein [unclassified Nocardioides]|uniref:SRPBCC family protein n=1 Tax=unclassified Nocardioides TaxID=2615069 RepID=UPI0000571E5F|nr:MULTISPECIES: SRPBCC family protein [unclassified Nocardioides]ABL79507.1 hypothetical protein Noca_4927 [Nocardioides sp. JS614]